MFTEPELCPKPTLIGSLPVAVTAKSESILLSD